jgi:IS30 family transposase
VEDGASGHQTVRNTIYRAIKDVVLKKEFPRKSIRGGEEDRRNGIIQPLLRATILYTGPECIENREWTGDLEGDTVYGGVGEGAMLTIADRNSRLLYATLVGSRDSGVVLDAFKRAIGDTPVNSITLDNGRGIAHRREIAARHNAPVYFADPYLPWQRGTNENMNGLIRFFFPKGTDFSKVTEEELQRVVSLINNRPRKCLGWLSPIEFLARLRCT